jgi:hypothetical protein
VRSKKLLTTELEGQMEYRLVPHPRNSSAHNCFPRCCRIHSRTSAHLSMPSFHSAICSFCGLTMRLGMRQGGGWRQDMGLDAHRAW